MGTLTATAKPVPTFWSESDTDRRVIITATNNSGRTWYDHMVSTSLSGLAPDSATLRVVEIDALGGVARSFDTRYVPTASLNRLMYLPHYLAGDDTITFKTLGWWALAETKRFAVYWQTKRGTAFTPQTYLDTAVFTGVDQTARVGPSRETGPAESTWGHAWPNGSPGYPTGLGSQANSFAIFGRQITSEFVRLMNYRINGNGTTFGFTGGTVSETRRNSHIVVTGTLTGATQWSGSYTATFENKIAAMQKADGTGGLTAIAKEVDVSRIVLTLTCIAAYTPINDPSSGTTVLNQAPISLNTSNNTWTGNTTTPTVDQMSTWYGDMTTGPTKLVLATDTNSLTVAGSIVGLSGTVMNEAVLINSVSLTGFTGQPNVMLKWYGAALQLAGTTNTATIPLNAQIVIDFWLANHGSNLAHTAGANMVARELLPIMRTLNDTPTITLGAVEWNAPQTLEMTARKASENAAAGIQWFSDVSFAVTGLQGNTGVAVDLLASVASPPDDDDGNYGEAYKLHGLCLRYLRTHDASVIPQIERQVQWHIDIEQSAVSTWGSFWSGSAPYWRWPSASPSTTYNTAEGKYQSGDTAVDPAYVASHPSFPNGGPQIYTLGQPRRASSIDQMHMVGLGLYGYLYLLRNEPAITANTTLWTNAMSLLMRMETFEAAHHVPANEILGNLRRRCQGIAPTTGNGITDTQLNSLTGVGLSNPYYGVQFNTWQVTNTADNTVINPSSNLALDDFFRAVYAPNTIESGLIRYMQGVALDMLASDFGRHDVTFGTASWGAITRHPKGWLPRAGATGNNYRYDVARAGDKHWMNLTAGGVRDSLSGRAAQRTATIILAALFDPEYVVRVEMDGTTVKRTVPIREACDDLIRSHSSYLVEPLTKANRHAANGFLGSGAPTTMQAPFTGYWMMAVELYLLLQKRIRGEIDVADYYGFSGV